MTRINTCAPDHLLDQHLFAEYRELPRIFTLVRKYVKQDKTPIDCALPVRFTFGPGHMKFFCNKLKWLAKRHRQIVAVLTARDYSPSNTAPLPWKDFPEEWWGREHWYPTEVTIRRGYERLQERLQMRPNFYTLNGVKVNWDYYKQFIIKG